MHWKYILKTQNRITWNQEAYSNRKKFKRESETHSEKALEECISLKGQK